MRKKGVNLYIVFLIIFLTSCGSMQAPDDIQDDTPSDILLASVEPMVTVKNTVASLKTSVEPETIKSGEGVYLEVITPKGTNEVKVFFPDPNGNGQDKEVSLEPKEGETETWVMPVATLFADGRVSYGDEPTKEVKDGGRRIYTPFNWDEETFPITIKTDTMQREFDIQVNGKLLNKLVIRPIDPRKPFPSGVSPIWEQNEDLFDGIVNWWVEK